MKKTVSERALIKRINRRIGGYDARNFVVWGERLCKARGYFAPWGTPVPYYLMDNWSNFITGTCSDLEEYAREIGALRDYERLDCDEELEVAQ